MPKASKSATVSKTAPTPVGASAIDSTQLNTICRRALYLAVRMIHIANHRSDKEKGDPKVGGHPAACASSVHILGALHLVLKTGFDHLAIKPHASPVDHAFHYLLDLFLREDFSRLSLAEANQAMSGLRAFSQAGEYVFQSYHSAYDCDNHNMLPSGTVGIPPVNAGYLAHAYRFAREQGFDVPDAHFWCLIGDAEFREGSLLEAMPDFAEREIGNLTWIVDYNRQSLDGHRISNRRIMGGTDDVRLERTAIANGWQALQVRHGRLRQRLFERKGGELFRQLLENELEDYELQALLMIKNPKELSAHFSELHPKLKQFINNISSQELFDGLRDLGGHDLEVLLEALRESQRDSRKPTLVIAHTLKGWGLSEAALPGNHSALVSEDELAHLQKQEGLAAELTFARFDEKSPEGQYLKGRSDSLLAQIRLQREYKEKNQSPFMHAKTDWPVSLDINTKMANYPHTQWMLGQLTAKLTRIANTPIDGNNDGASKGGTKALSEFETRWKLASELLVSMAPDVGTSTNLNPAMDGKVFGAPVVDDYESQFGVKDSKTPDLVPGEEASDRFLRFDISEGNVMSCMGSYGRLRDTLGIPVLPLMTVYDFFVKRALDQFFYNLYWRSSFILVGTPSGVTLSPEGAQHGWKSDIQIPNQITWEPFYVCELDWIFCDAYRRHVQNDNQGRSGVFIRCVTRGADQKSLLLHLRRQLRFKRAANGSASEHSLCLADFPIAGAINENNLEPLSDEEIMAQLRDDVLAGAYYLIDYRGYANYEPGDNVVHLFAMGSLGTEAIAASQALLSQGIYANVIMVTSPDLLCGNLAHENSYQLLKERLGVSGDLNLVSTPQVQNRAELVTLAGRRIPIVSIHDGEPGLLDNLGSIVGVRHEALCVRKHSRSGRPRDIYAYHHLNSEAIVEAAKELLRETAYVPIQIQAEILSELEQSDAFLSGSLSLRSFPLKSEQRPT